MNSNFIYFLSFLVLGIPLCTAQTQSLSLYNDTGCGGTLYRNMTSDGTYIIPTNGTVRSIRATGLWLVTQNVTGTQVVYSGLTSGQCTANLTQVNGTVVVRRLGDSAMKDSSAITLHTLSSFGGNEYKASSNSPNITFNMKSCWFTGANSTWVLYTGANYTGTATCLTPSNTVKQSGWGHTFEYDRSINVRSILKTSACPRGNGGSSISSFFSTIWNTGLLALLSMAVFNQQSL